MKKDYIVIQTNQNHNSTSNEIDFVNSYWTKIWEAQNLETALKAQQDQIERSEEFRLMNPLIQKLPKGSTLLDGGCGIGAWTLYYSAQGYKVTGVDISGKTIECLKKKFPEEDFQVGDIRHTRFTNNYFEAYFSWGTFEHFEMGLGPCLQEANRILKPKGYLFITIPFQNRNHIRRDRQSLWKWNEGFEKNKGNTQSVRFYQWKLTQRELEREFELYGFKPLKIQPIHKAQGLRRALKYDLHVQPESFTHNILQCLLYPLAPKSYIAHMLMGIGQKK